MSSILKALEKVDESQRPRRSANGGIGRGRERRPAWLLPAWTLGGAAVAALLTYALMGGFSRPAQVAEKSAPPAVAQAPTEAVQPVAEKQQQVQRMQPRQVAPPAPAVKVAAKPARPVAGAAVSGSQAVTKQSPAVKGARPVQNARPVSNAALQPAPVEAAAVPAVVREPAQQKSPQAIRVTGIAWQNSSESSFAMVNGRAMRQGAVVEGYRIEQIYEDSVRFSNSKGNSLVVPLGAGDE